MGAMEGKPDLIIASMKKPSLPESEGEEIIEGWTKDISEAWDEVKTRGRARNKNLRYVCINIFTSCTLGILYS